MPNLNVQLSGATLGIIDNAATVQRVNSPIATILGQVNASYYEAALLIPTPGTINLVLPATIVWLVYVRNISSSNNITVVGTPNGGAAWASGYVMPPTSIFCTFASFATNPAAGGFSAITLSASGANTYAEILLAA